MTPRNIGYLWGGLGVLGFSLTLPATRAAVLDIDPLVVGLGRALVAAVLAAILLFLKRQPLPPRRSIPQLFIVILGVIVGFPLLSAMAMQTAPASHGAVVTGVLPLATAICGAWRAGERPSMKFWLSAISGSMLVIFFSVISGSNSLYIADLLLLGAVFGAGLGYAEGAILARTLGSWQVICWALVYSAPFLAIFFIFHGVPLSPHVSSSAYLGFLYVSFISMFLAFFAWYLGLSMGGIARVGQVQLLQPFLTIFASAVLLGENLRSETIFFALGVGVCVLIGKNAPILKLQ
jgi:drug/metabolite transporter (DMT)-like permease